MTLEEILLSNEHRQFGADGYQFRRLFALYSFERKKYSSRVGSVKDLKSSLVGGESV